jgi:Putative Ig domain
MRGTGKTWRLVALAGLLAGLAVVVPFVASASGQQLQDELVFIQKGGQQKTGPYVEYLGANGTTSTQNLSLASGSCSSQTLTNPAAQPLLPLSASYYPNGYSSTPVDPATVGLATESGVSETGVCYNSKTSAGYTIQPGEGLDFGVGQSNPLTEGRVFSEATIPLKNNTTSSVSGTLVLRRLNAAGVEQTVDSVAFTVPNRAEGSSGDTNDCPVISTGVVPAADQFDQLEVQVSSPSKGSVSVVGPSCDNDNDADDVAYPTFYLDAAPAFTSANSTTFTVGSTGSFTAKATGYPTPTITDTCTASLPSGVTFTGGTGSATIAGTPAAGTGGTYTVCLSATNPDATVTQSFTLTVDQAPAFTSGAIPTFTAGSSSTFSITASGFPSPTITDTCTGSLPSGVTFTGGSGTATIGGTPAAGTGGTYNVCLSASNGVGQAATQTLLLTVDQQPTITSGGSASFTSGSSTAFTSGSPGSFTVRSSGFPAPSFSDTMPVPNCSTNLPSGVTFTDNGNGTATIAGTPATNSGGTYQVCITASNGVGPAATQVFLLTVDQAVAITSDNSAAFAAGGGSQSFMVTTTGFPDPSFTECSGTSLPTSNDISLVDNGNGTATISGSPTTSDLGTWTLCINAANSDSASAFTSSATQVFKLMITQPPQFTSADNDIVPASTAFTFLVTTSGYPPATISVDPSSSLPSGVTLANNGDGSANLASAYGIPAGTYTFLLDASNGVSPPAQQSFTLVVTSPQQQFTATQAPGSDVSASLNFTSGSKSYSSFTASGNQSTVSGSNPESVSFLTEGTNFYQANVNMTWYVPLCSPDQCAPTQISYDGVTFSNALFCTSAAAEVAALGEPAGTELWCITSDQFNYVTVNGAEVTQISQTWSGQGDPVAHQP